MSDRTDSAFAVESKLHLKLESGSRAAEHTHCWEEEHITAIFEATEDIRATIASKFDEDKVDELSEMHGKVLLMKEPIFDCLKTSERLSKDPSFCKEQSST